MIVVGNFKVFVDCRYAKPTFDFKQYHSFEEYENYMEDVANAFPSFVRLVVIGHTHEGRRLLVLKVSEVFVHLFHFTLWF